MLKRARMAGCMAAMVCASLPVRAETITVGAEDDWPPYSYVRPGQSEPQGLTPKLVRAAFQTQGIQVRYVVLPFARCMHDAEKGRVVGCFNATRTQGNSALFHWHPTPMFEEELAIFGRAGAEQARSLQQQDLQGHKVGITVGYTYPTEFMTDSRIIRQEATSDINVLRMLAAGRVEYVLANTLPALYRMSLEPALKDKVRRVGAIRKDGFWISFSKAHPDGERLCAVFEKGLQALRASGQYDRMLSEFHREWALSAPAAPVGAVP